MENNMNKTSKYNVGDKVVYLDVHKELSVGTISSIEKTNDGSKNLYLLSTSPYLRCEEDILEIKKSHF